MDPKAANAATAAAVVPLRVCLTTGASGRVTKWLAEEVAVGAGRLLPRVGASTSLTLAVLSGMTFAAAGGAHDGHRRRHLAAVDSCTS